jgi:hypothetical protein
VSKPYTESDFSSQITEERTWRFREIVSLRSTIERTDEPHRKVLLRALVAICYAHWEGYIKFAAKKYLEYVAIRKFQYSELNQQFFKNYFLPRLAGLAASKASIRQRCELLEDVLNSSNNRFARVNDELISTKSNLNLDVISDICVICTVSTAFFVDNGTFIDLILVKRRNEIAHGEETLIEMSDLEDIVTNTMAIMRNFGDALENNVYLKAFRR